MGKTLRRHSDLISLLAIQVLLLQLLASVLLATLPVNSTAAGLICSPFGVQKIATDFGQEPEAPTTQKCPFCVFAKTFKLFDVPVDGTVVLPSLRTAQIFTADFSKTPTTFQIHSTRSIRAPPSHLIFA